MMSQGKCKHGISADTLCQECGEPSMTPIPPIPEDLQELKRWIAVLFDQVTYSDSYGVEGSTFHVCRWCGGGSGPGGRPGFKHEISCLFDNDALETKVAGVWEEVPELEAEIKQLAERIAKLTAEVEQLKEQLRDEALAFNHANDACAKYEADATRLDAENTRLKASLEELVESMPAERCTDLNCGGDCGLRLRAERALSASPERDEWSRITPDNMPESGDEVFDKFGGVRLATEGNIRIWENCADGTFIFKRKFKAPLASRATRTPPQEGQ